VTLVVQAADGSKRQAEVQVTYGPILIKVLEDVGGLRSFWGQLGTVIEALESRQEVGA
jgi:hypothetical protein